jgi:hypothetical protein
MKWLFHAVTAEYAEDSRKEFFLLLFLSGFAPLRAIYLIKSPLSRNNSVSASFVLYLAAISLL